ncbi:hypothetical protein [Blastopirellula retiformator]|uniref:Bacterial type II secretion system protein G n=1 Tax=Blastopirellula retiformator TaxID=2527970 RepID=A0A5C5VKN5_9BACT|nr:hypothetical protein [Blastopirellula retiformator]TWT38563.1 hypothetical protein Enr8_02560 [Blastopirellula retiformator]
MKKKTLTYAIIGGIVLLSLAILIWIVAGPSGPIVVSKQTTHLTEPLSKNGLVDYHQAILEMQGNGVTPEQNAAIPYLQATWPAGIAPEDQPLVCDALQMPMPEAPGLPAYTGEANKSTILAWLNQNFAGEVAAGDLDPLTDADALDVLIAALAPWTRQQLPPLAAWLDEQAVHLDKLHEMNDRPRFFLPSPTLLRTKKSYLFACDLPTVMTQRDTQRVLLARANLRIGENQPEHAWEDIKTVFTLSDRHSRPGMLVELLHGIALRGVANSALQALLNSGQCDAQLLTEIDKHLAALGPMNEMATAIDTTERFMGLDAAIVISTDPVAAQEFFEGENPIGALANVPFDRNIMLVRLNEWYDQMTEALAIEDLTEREAAIGQVTVEIQEIGEEFKSPGNIAAALFSQRARGEAIARLMGALLLPAVMQVGAAEERVNIQLQLLRVAVKLEKWKLEQGDYPDSLDQLGDQIDPQLLIDPYAPGPLRYDRREPGYLLYSLFSNRIDDEGSSPWGDVIDGEWVDEEGVSIFPDGDMVLRFPLLKRPPLLTELEEEVHRNKAWRDDPEFQEMLEEQDPPLEDE